MTLYAPRSLEKCVCFSLHNRTDLQVGLFVKVSQFVTHHISLQLHPGFLLAVVSSPVRCKLRKLRGSDGVLPAFGMGEHAVLHSGFSAHRDLQCHDTEGQYLEET